MARKEDEVKLYLWGDKGYHYISQLGETCDEGIRKYITISTFPTSNGPTISILRVKLRTRGYIGQRRINYYPLPRDPKRSYLYVDY